MGRYFDALSLIMTALAIPKTYSEINLMSKVTTNTNSATPRFPPSRMANAPRVETKLDLNILTTMKVSTAVLCVTAPAIVPQANAVNRLPVHRFATTRRRRLASVFKFSARNHIPAKKSPSPPAIPPKISIMELCNAPLLPGHHSLRARRDFVVHRPQE